MRPAMMSAKETMPRTRGVAWRAVMRIQPMFSATAAATSSTQSPTKKAIAFWRRVTPRLYLGYGLFGDNRAVVFLVGHVLRDPGDFDVPGEPERLQRADGQPVEVELVPGQAVTGRGRMRVVVVVPPLAEGKQRHPPVVRRIVARREPAGSPDVRRRVHEPGAVQAEGRAEEDAPEHVRDAAEGEERQPDHH